MNRILLALLAVLVVVVTPPARAAGREQLQEFTHGLQGLDGRFQQQVFDANGRQIETASGTVRLSAPRLFRWEVVAPARQLIVADGDHIWIYDPDLEQVTVRNQSFEEQGSPLTILVDPSELDRQFRAADGGKADGLDWLVLTPRKAEDNPFQQARLGFGAKGLARMEFRDSLGQRTVIVFSGWKRNPAFPAGTFRFVPPPEADVIGEVSPGAEVTPLRD